MAYNDKEEENLALRRTNKITEEENIILKEDDKQLINQIRSLEDRMDNLKVQLKKEIIEEIYEEFEEREMKEKKKNNLIIFNIEETEYPSRQEKIQKELDTCIQVFKEIQSEVKDEDIVETFRIGKYRRKEGNEEGQEEEQTQIKRKPRPILVKLKDERTKWEIIKKAKTIRNSRNDTFRKVWIVPDLTMKERERDKELRRELQEKREAGEEGWYIRRGKLHRRNFL
ncbi:hypothetical protein Pmani_006359 [Petrolisthes manimaculis]|uniref:Uncharacterized protein n=1 Tax=Petrolisthes manimaculis TaxID=1843537 RepID=A0AAE1UL72_9EUCA|nr:hypothetical protein Pmani_006359 [Petrolisthes manimaculis]